MENKPKHTPGPWQAHDNDGTGTLPCVLSEKVNCGGNFYVAQCPNGNFADARLIAAAPELLEACKFALAQAGLSPDSPTAAILKAAIAKAEGKGE